MDIILQKCENIYYDKKKWCVRATMFADNTSITLPETGATVKGLSDDYYIAPGSSIFTTDGHIIFRGINGWGEWI